MLDGSSLLQVVPSLALSFSLYDTIRDACMVVHKKQQQHEWLQHQQQQLGLYDPTTASGGQELHNSISSIHGRGNAANRPRRRSFLGSPSDPQELAHSLSVASSVDQGTSLAQAAIWHMADQDARVASSSPSQQADKAAAAGAIGSGRTSAAAGSSSCNTADANSRSSSRALSDMGHTEVPAGISLVSGCMSGFVTATVTFPLDVIRRRMQVGSNQE